MAYFVSFLPDNVSIRSRIVAFQPGDALSLEFYSDERDIRDFCDAPEQTTSNDVKVGNLALRLV
jgi:hypothetical protein